MVTHKQKQLTCISATIVFILAILLFPFYSIQITLGFCGIVIVLFFIEKIFKKSNEVIQ